MRDSSLWPPCDVTVSPMGGITGWMSWPYDLIYRPLVGLFARGSLLAAVPTFRIRQVISGKSSPPWKDPWKAALSAPRSDWICAFHFAADRGSVEVGLRDISVVCLETGQVLYPELNPHDLDDAKVVLTVDDVITRALYLQQPPDVSGFRHFLSLSTRDQLAVVYLAVLGREIDLDALEAYDAQLMQNGGAYSILDIRDRVVASPEFASRKISLHERVGLWIVWGGLCEVVPSVLPMAASLRSDARETTGAQRGPAASETDAVGPWSEQSVGRDLRSVDHRSRGDLFPPLSSDGAAPPAVSRVGLRFPDLLSSMLVGPAGAQRENGVRAVRGREGIVVFGPYLTLPPGHYSLTVSIEEETPDELADHVNDIRIEAVYQRIMLGRIFLSSRDLRPVPQVMPFVVPQLSRGGLDDALFEFQVWARGLRGYFIRSLSLEVVPPCKGRIELDWLPLMRVGRAGQRISDDRPEVSASLTARGHVVFGPYVRMLPGRYRLVVECTILGSAGPKTDIDVEVAIAADQNLAARTYELTRGPHRLELEFIISQDIFSRKEGGDVEFRVHKAAGSELIITGIKTVYEIPYRDRSDSPGISSDLGDAGTPIDRAQRVPAVQPGKETWASRLRYHWLSRLPRRRRTDHPQN